MTEERLKEIKDSLDTPIWILTQRTFAKSYMEIHLQQEIELYNEVVRLREIIDNYNNVKKELLDYIYHNEYCRFGHIDGGEADDMREILNKSNLTLEQLGGIDDL